MIVRTALAATLFAIAHATVPASAKADNRDLARFLLSVEEARAFAQPARADLRIEVAQHPDGRRFDGVAVYDGVNVYVELQDPALRVLILGKEGSVFLSSAGAAAKKASAHEPLGTTTLVPDDFTLFRSDALKFPQITSQTRQTLLINGAPRPGSPYVLIAYLLDREKRVPLRVQYYERVVSNLVRMRNDEALVEMSGVWRPQATEIEDYRTGTVTKIARKWTPLTDLPSGLFDPEKLAERNLLGDDAGSRPLVGDAVQ